MRTIDEALNPNSSVLCKIGSIIVHIDEGLSSKGHPFDLVAIRALINDSEVRRWLVAMDNNCLLPLRRDDKHYQKKKTNT